MLSLLGAAVASREMSAPLDAALSNNSKFLYVLNSGTESITALSVSNDGSLHFLQDVAGLPNGSAGLAAK
jgi:6-phosphogluconolactonase (cycloisomerase 2 family)